MKVALLRQYPTESTNLDEQFQSVGMNSGNIVYWEALLRLFKPDIVSYNDSEKLRNYDAVIITDLCWIRENAEFEYIENFLDRFSIPFIPMSIGLQNNNFNPDFQLSDQLVRTLQKLQERAVLGVRGEYTASILRKYGITNIAIIGCPSMYYWNNRELKIVDNGSPINVCCNFRSLYGKLSSKDIDILKYFSANDCLFVEQTNKNIEYDQVGDYRQTQELRDYIDNSRLLEFHYDKWVKRLEEYNFSIGCRFHGNVLPLHQNMKALFVTIDSRTQEMIDIFHLPHIKIENFDITKPMEYYFKLADYTAFNENYPKMYDTFLRFAADNKLKIDESVEPLYFVPKRDIKKNTIINKKNKSKIFRDIFLNSVGDGDKSVWISSHSKLASFDKTKKMLINGDEENGWNILSQKIDFSCLKGEELTLCVKSKSINNARLYLFARYKQPNEQYKYLATCVVQNSNEHTDYLNFVIPYDFPDNAELFVGVHITEPNKEVCLKEIKLLKLC